MRTYLVLCLGLASCTSGGGGASVSDGSAILDALFSAEATPSAPVDGRAPAPKADAAASAVYRHPEIVARIKVVPQVFGAVLTQPPERVGQVLFPYDDMPLGKYCWKDLAAPTPPGSGRIGTVWTGKELVEIKGVWFSVDRFATEAEIAAIPRGGVAASIDTWIDAKLARGTNPMTGALYLDEAIETLNRTVLPGSVYMCKPLPGGS